MLIVIKEMNRNAFLPEKIIQGAVSIQGAETIQITNPLHRDIFRRPLHSLLIYRDKFQRIVFAAHPAGVKEVVGFFHGN